MKKALVFLGNTDFMGLEEAMIHYKKGYDIFLVACDKSMGVCNANYFISPALCHLCKATTKNKVLPLVKKYKWHIISLSDLITKESRENAVNAKFEYSNVQELKNLTYRGVDIGYGAFSTFVTYTRNVMPTFNEYLYKYIDYELRHEMMMTDAMIKYVDEISPNLVIFFNGRIANSKPIACIAKNRGIDYITTERLIVDGPKPDKYRIVLKFDFYNDSSLSFKARHFFMEEQWEKGGEDKYIKAKCFFEDRYHARPAGDVIYTKKQRLGELPPGFDKNKRNISIFNSSEDEYCAISKEFDDAALFPTQYDALKTLFEHYKDDPTIHFYLRIHPNLAKVPYRSHTALYTLKYDNVTIISPQDSVSSYTLMDNSEKVIVFMSTMGLESSYWGKPVIALNRCFYSYQNVVYEPKTVNEFFCLIDNKELKRIEQPIENWYKVAYSFGGNVGDQYDYFPTKQYRFTNPISKKSILYFSGFKILGSTRIQGLLRGIFATLAAKTPLGKFNEKSFLKTM